MARIDDWLVRRSQVPQRLREALCRERYTGLSDPRLDLLRREVKASEKETVNALFDLLMEGRSPEETYAFILLKDLDHNLAAVRAAEISKYPNLTAHQRRRVQEIVGSWNLNLWMRGVEQPITRPGSHDYQRLQALLGQKSLQEEEVGTLWLWATRMVSPSVRGMLLRELADRHPGRLLAAVAVELAENDLAALRRLVPILGACPEVEAGELLQRLAEHPNLDIRTEADQVLRARGTLGTKDPRPEFVGARLHENLATGLHVVAYATRERKKSCCVLVAILDTWDGGIVDCWGQSRLMKTDVKVVFSFAGRLAPLSSPQELEGRVAAGWLLEGEKLTIRRNLPLPASWPVWRRLIRASPEPLRPPGVAFGLICTECREPIRRGPSAINTPLVLGSLVLCASCLRKERRCSGCHRRLQPRTAHAVTHPHSPHVDFYCDACYANRVPQRSPHA